MAAPTLSELIARLISEAPGSGVADRVARAIESLLMSALQNGGRSAVEAEMDALTQYGYTLKRVPPLPCFWRVALPPPRVLEVWFTGKEVLYVAAVSYRMGKPWGTRRQRAAARRQDEFYGRYERLVEPNASWTAHDRLVSLVGALEADVNNGGFSQYLSNKGEQVAREALACLSTIGAKRTATWLSSALTAAQGSDEVALLDRQFVEQGEDLAVLVMKYIERAEGPARVRKRG